MVRAQDLAGDARALYGPVASRPAAADMGDGALWVDPGAGHALYQVQSGNWVTISPGESGGSVTSVGLATSGLLHSVSGSPVTGSGTLSLDLKTQVRNTVLAGPGSGADAAPTMRALVAADIPSLDAAAIGSGTLALARLAGITHSQLDSAAGILAAQIAAVNPSALVGSGTVPLAALSGLTTSQLAAAAGIAAGQIASVNPAALTGSGTVPEAGLPKVGVLFARTALEVSDFSWVNQGSATATAYQGGVSLAAAADAAGPLRLLVRSAPGTPYTITALLLPSVMLPTFAGLCFRESSSGKIVACYVGGSSGQGLNVAKWTNPTTFAAAYNQLPFGNIVGFLGPLWLRIADDGTNRLCSISGDGLNFVPMHTVGRTDFLTADQVGFLVCSGSATYNAALTVLSWAAA